MKIFKKKWWVVILVVAVSGFAIFHFSGGRQNPTVKDKVKKVSDPKEAVFSKRVMSEDFRKTLKTPEQYESAISELWISEDYDEVVYLYEYWLKKDPTKAIQFVVDMPVPLRRSHFEISLRAYFDDLPLEQALTLVGSFDQLHTVQLAVIGDRIEEWSKEDPDAVLAWLEVENEKPMVPLLAKKLGRNNEFGLPEESFLTFLTLPEGQVQNNLVTGAMEGWLATDPEKAAAFLNEIPADAIFDQAIFGYIEELTKSDHKIAMVWAELLVKPDLKQMAIAEVSHYWENSDPESFKEWKKEK